MGSSAPKQGHHADEGAEGAVGSEDGDDDDDDDDYMDEIPSLSKGSTYNRDRKRDSVCAEIVLENQDDVKEFEKTPEERMRILEILE